MNTTTRRYPRSLREAFPADRFPTVEHYRRPSIATLETVAGVVVTLALVAMFLYALLEWAAQP